MCILLKMEILKLLGINRAHNSNDYVNMNGLLPQNPLKD